MEFDWTVKRIDFMKEIFEAVKEKEDLEAVLTDYEENIYCGNCAFLDVCNLVGQNLSCYDTLKTVYKEYCKEFEKETTTEKIAEKTKEKMLVFIKSDCGTDILRVTAEQNKIIRYFAENSYLLEDVKIYTEDTLEYEVTDLT